MKSTAISVGENHQPRIEYDLQHNVNLMLLIVRPQWGGKRRRTGSRIWQPTTSESGMIKAHWYPGICHSKGITSVVKITIIAMHRKHIMKESLKRRHIAGTISNQRGQQSHHKTDDIHAPSIQKVERSTSLPVDPHVLSGIKSVTHYGQTNTSFGIRFMKSKQNAYISYENMCASKAVDKWILRPPKKKTLWKEQE